VAGEPVARAADPALHRDRRAADDGGRLFVGEIIDGDERERLASGDEAGDEASSQGRDRVVTQWRNMNAKKTASWNHYRCKV
jgi:hypothetical protein